MSTNFHEIVRRGGTCDWQQTIRCQLLDPEHGAAPGIFTIVGYRQLYIRANFVTGKFQTLSTNFLDRCDVSLATDHRIRDF